MSNHPLLGKPAPALSLPNADGTSYELKPGGQGKPTAVFFYPKAGACPRFIANPSYCGVLPSVVSTQVLLAARKRCAHFAMR